MFSLRVLNILFLLTVWMMHWDIATYISMLDPHSVPQPTGDMGTGAFCLSHPLSGSWKLLQSEVSASEVILNVLYGPFHGPSFLFHYRIAPFSGGKFSAYVQHCKFFFWEMTSRSLPEMSVCANLAEWTETSSSRSACCRYVTFMSLLIKNSICSSIPDTIDPLQFTYRPNRSTENAISHVLHTTLTQ